MKQKIFVFGGILALLVALAGCAGTAETSGGNLEMQLNEILEKSLSTLGGISNSDQAMGALNVLKDQEALLADVVDQSESATPTVQFNLTQAARDALPKFQEEAIRAMDIPGVAEKIGPTVKSMTEHLTGLL